MNLSEARDIARQLHQSNCVADLHNDFLLTHYLFGYDIMKRHKHPIPYSPLVCHVDVPRIKDAGVNIVGSGLVCTPLKIFEKRRFHQIRSQMEYLKRVAAQYPDKIRHVSTVADLEKALEEGVPICFPGIEGAHALVGDINLLDTFFDMGVRYFTLAHFTGNEACNCPMGIYNYNDPGLTGFGRKLVDRIHELGIVLDLAHTEEKAFLEAAERSEKPVIVSHTGVKGAYNHWRNITDEQVKAVSKTGGVVGIIIAPQYLGGSHFRPLDDVADHILHVADLVGAEHVGFGSDLDGWIHTMPKGFSDIADLPKITELLLMRGMTEKDVKNVIGENVAGVMKKCLPNN